MSTIQILALDDDPDFGSLLKLKLKAPAFQVTVCETAESFLLEAKNPKFQLFLLDLNLGKGLPTGGAVLEVLRRHHKNHTPAIMLSQLDDFKGIQACLELGADDFVTKPLDEVLLKAKISALLAPDELEQGLHVGRVPAPKSSISLAADTQLLEVNEIGLRLMALFFIRKGALVRLQAELIKEMTGNEAVTMTVVQSEMGGNGRYMMQLEFDPDDRALLANVRAWIG